MSFSATAPVSELDLRSRFRLSLAGSSIMTGRIEFTVRGLNGLAALRPGCSPRVALHEDISAPQLPSVTGWLTWPDRDFHPAMLAPLQAHERGHSCPLLWYSHSKADECSRGADRDLSQVAARPRFRKCMVILQEPAWRTRCGRGTARGPRLKSPVAYWQILVALDKNVRAPIAIVSDVG